MCDAEGLGWRSNSGGTPLPKTGALASAAQSTPRKWHRLHFSPYQEHCRIADTLQHVGPVVTQPNAISFPQQHVSVGWGAGQPYCALFHFDVAHAKVWGEAENLTVGQADGAR